jgi:hypothetical protein
MPQAVHEAAMRRAQASIAGVWCVAGQPKAWNINVACTVWFEVFDASVAAAAAAGAASQLFPVPAQLQPPKMRYLPWHH